MRGVVQGATFDASSNAGGSRLPALAASLAFVAFLPSLFAGYVYDDRLLISENPYAQSLRFLGRTFRTHLWDVFAAGAGQLNLCYYRPLVSASYIVNWVFGGGSAWTFHLVNVAAHALATLLAARVAARFIGSDRLGFVAALLFALHPTRTESVIWVSGRTDVFMALFALLAVELAHRAASAREGRFAFFSGLAVLATAAAILSKEAGAMTALLVFVDFLASERGSVARRRLGLLTGILGVMGLTYVLARAWLYPVHQRQVEVEPTFRYGLFTVWAYVERLVWPWPQTFFYRPMQERGGVPYFPPGLLALGAAASVAYGALLVRALRRDRVAFVLLGAALVFIGPLLNFTFTGIYVTTSDHFLYLPLLVAASGLFRLFRAELSRVAEVRAAWVALCGLCAVYLAVNVLRVLDYRSEEALLWRELDVNPDNPVVLQNLSSAIARTSDLRAARALQARVVAPSAKRFFLLAGSVTDRNISKGRLVALDAALTADGDAVALGRFEDELERLLFSMHSWEDDSRLTPDGVLRESAMHPQLASLVADAALVATRVGRAQRAKRLVDALPDEMLWHVSSPLNFMLTIARLGDFKRAAHLVSIADKPPAGPRAAPPEALAELSARVGSASKLMHAALKDPEPKAHIDLSLAFAELGAYLQALRVLRPVFDATPHPPDVDPLYVQLLVSARLESEAFRIAKGVLGDREGEAAVTALRAQLSPRVREIPALGETAWWP